MSNGHKMLKTAIRACGVLFLYSAVVQADPVTWEVSAGGNGHRYEAFEVTNGITWAEANAAATAMDGFLATIESEAENNFVYSLVSNFPDSIHWMGPWLGGLQLPGSEEPAGGWVWVTGKPLTYTNWAPDEPNDWPEEDRIHFRGRDSTWNDLHHDRDTNGYVVEIVPKGMKLVVW